MLVCIDWAAGLPVQIRRATEKDFPAIAASRQLVVILARNQVSNPVDISVVVDLHCCIRCTQRQWVVSGSWEVQSSCSWILYRLWILTGLGS